MNSIKIYSKDKLCVVLHEGEEKSVVSFVERGSFAGRYRLSVASLVDNNRLLGLSELESIVAEITSQHNETIKALEVKLQPTDSNSHKESYDADVLSLKNRIKTVAGRLSKCDLEHEDESFGNYLHEIWQLKKQLGSYKNEYTGIARKANSRVKYDIRQENIRYFEDITLLDGNLVYEILEKGEAKRVYG
jgi:hypothetical protein